ncbi:arylsulfatase B-like [Oratosquilla oratoria]|uniref:arylsulfatase B-like n=1 Tax=Oratosquilla oratoria TaxID=337810 RepID=UPI003F762313
MTVAQRSVVEQCKTAVMGSLGALSSSSARMKSSYLSLCFCFLVLAGNFELHQTRNAPPNIVFLLADDLGWNDVSWHNSDVISPHLQQLQDTGIKLDQHYVQPTCTPTRAALLTGHYPYKMGRQGLCLKPKQPTGLTLDKTLLPEKLKELGYSTHLVGKWHLGFCDWAYTPTRRGFDTFYGFYLGSGDHYEHTRTDGYDFRDQENVDFSASGIYSTTLFTKRSVEILRNASQVDRPFFLLVAFQNVHGPKQVPDHYADLYPATLPEETRTLFGMATAMDEAVGNIVRTLKETGLYENTLIVFSSDNGAPLDNKGSNYPLRGNKGSVWEGGTRSVSFIHSPLLGPNVPRVHGGLFHVTDWYNTLLEAASSVREGDQESRQLPNNDGVSQWKTLTENAPTTRHWIVYNLDRENGSLIGGIRYRQYKYVFGPQEFGMDNKPWIFDIEKDPEEEHNLVEEFPDLAASFHAKLETLATEMVSSDDLLEVSDGKPSKRGNVWSPGWCSSSP